MRLTERDLATGVTKNDLIHIVITGDTTDSPEGSSYKARVGQLLELYDLPVPLVKLQFSIDGIGTTASTINNNNTVGPPIILINPPSITTRDISNEQIEHGVYIEMVQYKMKRFSLEFSSSTGGGFIVQPGIEDDGDGGIRNKLQYEIFSQYGKKITTRGGVQQGRRRLPENIYDLAINRVNHYKVIKPNEICDLSNYFNGRYSYRNILYTGSSGTLLDYDVFIPATNANANRKSKTKSGNDGTPYKLCYRGGITSLYVAFRYLMFDPDSNEGKGKFIEGPLSQTIKVSNKYFPFLKTSTNGRCTIHPLVDDGYDNLIKFMFV